MNVHIVKMLPMYWEVILKKVGIQKLSVTQGLNVIAVIMELTLIWSYSMGDKKSNIPLTEGQQSIVDKLSALPSPSEEDLMGKSFAQFKASLELRKAFNEASPEAIRALGDFVFNDLDSDE